MGKSIGLIETLGLVASIESLDAALKAASVKLISKELADGGLVMMTFEGDVGAVTAAVEAGVEAVKRMGRPVSGHVIARLSDEVLDIIETTETLDQGNAHQTHDFQESEIRISDQNTPQNALMFNGQSYAVFKKGGIDRLKVVELRQLAREIEIQSMDRHKIKFANKTELISAIRKHMRGGTE